MAMTVEIKNGKLCIEIGLETTNLSASVKTLVVASNHDNTAASDMIEGKPLRMPKAVAMDAVSVVKIMVEENQIVIRPMVDKKQELAILLAGVTDNNLHRETDTGEVVGNEIW